MVKKYVAGQALEMLDDFDVSEGKESSM